MNPEITHLVDMIQKYTKLSDWEAKALWKLNIQETLKTILDILDKN